MGKNSSDILIRNVNAESLKKLERLASESKMSRNEYLNALLERHAQSRELTEQRFMYEELVERLTAALESSNEVTQAVASELRDIKVEMEVLRRERS